MFLPWNPVFQLQLSIQGGALDPRRVSPLYISGVLESPLKYLSNTESVITDDEPWTFKVIRPWCYYLRWTRQAEEAGHLKEELEKRPREAELICGI